MTRGSLRVHRTGRGYVAVLRVQGSDGSSIGMVSRVSDTSLQRGAAEVGISLAGIARGIGRAASKIAKSKVFRQFVNTAKLLPPPISAVASAAASARTVLLAMRAKGDPAARREWERAAAIARAQPTSPIAAGMRLAMDAAGPPRMASRATLLAREVLAEVEAQRAAPPAPAAPEGAS